MSTNPDRTFLTDFDFLASAALAVAITGLAIGWFAQSVDSGFEQARQVSAEDRFTLTQDGRMKVTVTAQRPKDLQAAVGQRPPV
jgi:hypothetical protein